MLTDKTALITGVSSGIGKSLLLALQKEGCLVHGIVKSEQRRETLYKELATLLSPEEQKNIRLHVCDLRNPAEIEQFSQELHKERISPDILVLNAGVGFYGPHEELSVKAITELTAVNFTAPLLLTNLFLRDLKKTLKQAGIENLLVCNRNQNSINPAMLDCDYYRFLDGDISAIQEFEDEYMIDYSWAEPTVALLMHKKNKFVQ